MWGGHSCPPPLIWVLLSELRSKWDLQQPPRQPLAADPDSPAALPFPLQRNLYVPLAQQPRKFLSPLDQQNTIVGAQVIQSERFQFARRVDAVKINVIEVGAGPAIFMHQRKGGTGDVFLRGRFERRRD